MPSPRDGKPDVIGMRSIARLSTPTVSRRPARRLRRGRANAPPPWRRGLRGADCRVGRAGLARTRLAGPVALAWPAANRREEGFGGRGAAALCLFATDLSLLAGHDQALSQEAGFSVIRQFHCFGAAVRVPTSQPERARRLFQIMPSLFKEIVRPLAARLQGLSIRRQRAWRVELPCRESDALETILAKTCRKCRRAEDTHRHDNRNINAKQHRIYSLIYMNFA